MTVDNVVALRPSEPARGWLSLARRRRAWLASLLLILFPLIVPFKALAAQILVYGLYALGLNLLFGYLGLLSFGHAALFGVGAYFCGIAVATFGLPWWAGIGLGIFGGTLAAALIGALAIRTRGIYFAMVTLALAQCVYYLFYEEAGWTGGESGLTGVDVKTIDLFGVSFNFVDPLVHYYVICAFVVAALFALSRILASPFGAVIEGVRENEARARASGIDVSRVRLVTFIVSGAFCGLAGALLSLNLSIVSIETLNYETSGLAVMMCLLGGMGTFFGPFVGAALFLLLENIVSLYTVHWQLIVGAAFVACVLFFPRGVWGTLMQGLEK